eukprot:gene1641-33032_t
MLYFTRLGNLWNKNSFGNPFVVREDQISGFSELGETLIMGDFNARAGEESEMPLNIEVHRLDRALNEDTMVSHNVTLIAPSGKHQPVRLSVVTSGVTLSTLSGQDINTFPFQDIKKWFPSSMYSAHSGDDDCLDMQVETEHGVRNLRMKCTNEAAVKHLIKDLRITVQEILDASGADAIAVAGMPPPKAEDSFEGVDADDLEDFMSESGTPQASPLSPVSEESDATQGQVTNFLETDSKQAAAISASPAKGAHAPASPAPPAPQPTTGEIQPEAITSDTTHHAGFSVISAVAPESEEIQATEIHEINSYSLELDDFDSDSFTAAKRGGIVYGVNGDGDSSDDGSGDMEPVLVSNLMVSIEDMMPMVEANDTIAGPVHGAHSLTASAPRGMEGLAQAKPASADRILDASAPREMMDVAQADQHTIGAFSILAESTAVSGQLGSDVPVGQCQLDSDVPVGQCQLDSDVPVGQCQLDMMTSKDEANLSAPREASDVSADLSAPKESDSDDLSTPKESDSDDLSAPTESDSDDLSAPKESDSDDLSAPKESDSDDLSTPKESDSDDLSAPEEGDSDDLSAHKESNTPHADDLDIKDGAYVPIDMSALEEDAGVPSDAQAAKENSEVSADLSESEDGAYVPIDLSALEEDTDESADAPSSEEFTNASADPLASKESADVGNNEMVLGPDGPPELSEDADVSGIVTETFNVSPLSPAAAADATGCIASHGLSGDATDGVQGVDGTLAETINVTADPAATASDATRDPSHGLTGDAHDGVQGSNALADADASCTSANTAVEPAVASVAATGASAGDVHVHDIASVAAASACTGAGDVPTLTELNPTDAYLHVGDEPIIAGVDAADVSAAAESTDLTQISSSQTETRNDASAQTTTDPAVRSVGDGSHPMAAVAGAAPAASESLATVSGTMQGAASGVMFDAVVAASDGLESDLDDYSTESGAAAFMSGCVDATESTTPDSIATESTDSTVALMSGHIYSTDSMNPDGSAFAIGAVATAEGHETTITITKLDSGTGLCAGTDINTTEAVTDIDTTKAVTDIDTTEAVTDIDTTKAVTDVNISGIESSLSQTMDSVAGTDSTSAVVTPVGGTDPTLAVPTPVDDTDPSSLVSSHLSQIMDSVDGSGPASAVLPLVGGTCPILTVLTPVDGTDLASTAMSPVGLATELVDDSDMAQHTAQASSEMHCSDVFNAEAASLALPGPPPSEALVAEDTIFSYDDPVLRDEPTPPMVAPPVLRQCQSFTMIAQEAQIMEYNSKITFLESLVQRLSKELARAGPPSRARAASVYSMAKQLEEQDDESHFPGWLLDQLYLDPLLVAYDKRIQALDTDNQQRAELIEKLVEEHEDQCLELTKMIDIRSTELEIKEAAEELREMEFREMVQLEIKEAAEELREMEFRELVQLEIKEAAEELREMEFRELVQLEIKEAAEELREMEFRELVQAKEDLTHMHQEAEAELTAKEDLKHWHQETEAELTAKEDLSQAKEDLTQRHQETEAELQLLRDEFGKHALEHEHRSAQTQQTQAELMCLRDELEHHALERERRSVQAQETEAGLMRLRDELERRDQEQELRSVQTQETEAELMRLRSELEKRDQDQVQRAMQTNETEAELQHLRAELERHQQQERLELVERLQEMKAERLELVDKHQEMEAELQRLVADLEMRDEQELRSVQDNASVLAAAHQSNMRLQEIEGRYTRALEAVNVAEDQAKSAEARLAELNAILEDERMDATTTERALSEMRHQNAILVDEHAAVEKRCQMSLGAQSAAQRELGALRERCEMYNAKAVSLALEVEQLQMALKDVELKLTTYKNNDLEVHGRIKEAFEAADDAKKSREVAVAHNAELQCEADALKQNTCELEAACNNLNAELQASAAAYALAEGELDTTRNIKGISTTSIKGASALLVSRVIEHQTSISSLTTKNRWLEGELATLKVNLGEALSSKSRISLMSLSALEKVQDLEREREESNQKLESMARRLERCTTEWQHESKSSAVEISSLKKRASELEARFDVATAEAAGCVHQLTEVAKELQVSQVVNDELRRELQVSKAVNDELRGELQVSQAVNDELRGKLREGAEAADAERMMEVKMLTAKLEASMAGCARSVAGAEKALVAKEALLARWKEEAQVVTTKLERAIVEHKQDLGDKERDVVSLKRQVDSLLRENGQLSSKLATANTTKEENPTVHMQVLASDASEADHERDVKALRALVQGLTPKQGKAAKSRTSGGASTNKDESLAKYGAIKRGVHLKPAPFKG